MKTVMNKKFMDIALEEAKLALEEGEVPVGAVVVKDGVVISTGRNHREKRGDISSHAEIEAIKAAEKTLGKWQLEGCSLYVTLEPCLMCAGAIKQARSSSVTYGADDAQEGAFTKYGLLTDWPLLVFRGERKEEAEDLLKQFFALQRN